MSDDNSRARLRIAKQVEERYEKGRDHFKAKRYKQAFQCLLFVLDNSHGISSWGGVRLSYVPSLIAEIGQHYPPALDALRARRDSREKLILKGEKDHSVIAEWTSFNRYLKDKDHELRVMETLRKKGKLSERLEERVVGDNIQLLMKRGQYDLLARRLPVQVQFCYMELAQYEAESMFPGSMSAKVVGHKEYLKQTKDVARRKGIECFQIALGAGKLRGAESIMEKLLAVANDKRTFAGLLEAAANVGNDKMHAKILSKAKKSLGADKYKKLV